MPSFSLASQFKSAKIHAKFYKEEQGNIYNNAAAVINDCNALNVNNTRNIAFARELGRYLDTRRNTIHFFCDNSAQVASRSAFVGTLLVHINANDIDQQLNMLREENILRFKGFFTQRLYDILVSRRTELHRAINKSGVGFKK